MISNPTLSFLSSRRVEGRSMSCRQISFSDLWSAEADLPVVILSDNLMKR